MPSATAADDPLLEPPAVRLVSSGLLHCPKSG